MRCRLCPIAIATTAGGTRADGKIVAPESLPNSPKLEAHLLFNFEEFPSRLLLITLA